MIGLPRSEIGSQSGNSDPNSLPSKLADSSVSESLPRNASSVLKATVFYSLGE
jgi:hypothetical protein